MVDKNVFFGIADQIRDEGREPTQRAIREPLGRGSFSDLGPLFVGKRFGDPTYEISARSISC